MAEFPSVDQHIYHHNDSDGLRVNMAVEKNSRGYNFSATIVGAKTVEEAIQAMDAAETALRLKYGASVEQPVPAATDKKPSSKKSGEGEAVQS